MGKDHELIEAARNGNITIVEKILYQKAKRSGPLASLRRGPGANFQDSSGYSSLHHAALNGHTDVVRLLLSHDASPNLPDTRGSSPLHLAAWAGHQDIVNLLLSHPYRAANPNLQTVDNETPLHCAAQHGHTGALSTLLAYGANPNVTNNRGETPLDLAAQYGRLQAVQMLIRAHPELLLPFKDDRTVHHSPLHLASRNGHKSVVDVLLAAGVNVNLLTASGTALHEAALCGKDSVVRALLNTGADLDATDSEGRTALDLLDQFPPHVTKGIVSVINNHRYSIGDDSETDDVRKPIGSKYMNMSMSGSYSVDNNQSSYINSHWNIGNNEKTSPSPSVGSLGLSSSPTPRSLRPPIGDGSGCAGRGGSVDTIGYYVSMAPVNNSKVSPTPPKKPPRRNLSVSPTHTLMSTSIDGGYGGGMGLGVGGGGGSIDNSRHSRPRAYEYLFLARSGAKSNTDDPGGLDEYLQNFKIDRTASVDQYVQMNPRNENPGMRSYNPNRKLRRNRDNYEHFCIRNNLETDDRSTITTTITSSVPMSPSHYKQPPTPEHPPPNALQAENFIHDRIRPLSQEYKRRTGELRDKNEIGTSPPFDTLCQSLGASSGSLSSSVSLSDRSASTDCVEEFIGDAPFAGLFKGSTITLDNPNPQFIHIQLNTHSKSQQHPVERPKTLRTSMVTPIKKSISFENNQIQHNMSTNSEDNSGVEDKNLGILSPFDEQEEWAKISEIMATFGTGFVKESVFASDSEVNDLKKKRRSIRNSISSPRSRDGSLDDLDQSTSIALADWFYENSLEQFETIFLENGFDNLEFINGILDESDLIQMNIDESIWPQIFDAVNQLPKTPSFYQNNNNVLTITVDQWLESIQLTEYIEVFKKHLYNDMDRICRIWEIELQTVLEIHKNGHRKRILRSVANQQLSPRRITDGNHHKLPDTTTLMDTGSDNEKITEQPQPQQRTPSSSANGINKTHHRKNRPAPQPPFRMQNLNLRGPSELLLGVPTGLQTQWRHNASSLVTDQVKYDVYYLGSTVVKELRGTESTRKSIQKIKRGDRLGAAIGTQSAITNFKRPLRLAISYRGVQFIDIKTQESICEHEIRNIDCACQDADDLAHFAYITKDLDYNTHYCHVFNVESMDLATEIILTLGQAFEVAYQIALKENTSSNSSLRSPSDGLTFLNQRKSQHSVNGLC